MTGEVLRRWRLKMHLTQEELARRLGVTVGAVSRWERGDRPIPSLLTRAMRDLEEELAADPEWQGEHNRRVQAEMERKLAEKEANPPAEGSAEREWFAPHNKRGNQDA